MTLHLLPHPQSPASPVSAIGVNVARLEDGQLSLQFTAVGRREDVLLPPLAGARRADELWRHTCFEAFVAPLRREPYYEFNFSPSGEWAVYRFDSYRSGMSKPDL